MRHARLALALVAASALAACAGALPAGQPLHWRSASGPATPTLADSSDCRFQARRQAETRFPDRVLDVPTRPGGRTSVTLPADGDRLAAEIRFYTQCMRQKGFELVDTASA